MNAGGNLQTIGQRIKHYRLRKALDQQMLGNKVGVSKQTVSNWENDYKLPSAKNLQQLADVFNVTTDYLMIGDKEPEKLTPHQHDLYEELKEPDAILSYDGKPISDETKKWLAKFLDSMDE